ncbi:hypothetical protein B0H16DRAFT_1887517 [Mycena metata]|uniref:BTB domain-containing protein n=1 Tax=Mycena metata TaxID=1033252 RepID=A0AAD7IXG3_9AGAR|nr:hypothetical protein B0H16DRAFT_1887517 [Mycena metata]
MSDPTPDIPSAEPPPVESFTPTFPFVNVPGHDTILRSSDGVDFHVHRIILGLVSPVFETMFQLPQPESSPTIPVIDVEEKAAVLDRMLRLFYPATRPTFATLDELRETINVVVSKYDMQAVVPTIEQELQKFVGTHPVSVYALAVTYQWKDVARAAAKESLRHAIRTPPAETTPGLDDLSAAAYQRLLRYHYLCGLKGKSTVDGLWWVPTGLVWSTCTTCAGHELNWYLADGQPYPVRKWFTDFLAQMGDILLVTPAANILESKSMYDALKKASQCATCRTLVFEQLKDFVVNHWMPKLATLIDAVELQF